MARNGMSICMAINIIIVIFIDAASAGANVTDVIVPPSPKRNTNVTLECLYDTSVDIYSLQWYHNGVEIYKYVPSVSPDEDDEISVFPNDNLEIIQVNAKPQKIILKEIDITAAGEYKCEIIHAGQGFKSNSKSANMTVVEIPEEPPNIEGDVPGHYTVGDFVNLNCSAAPSIPVAVLLWSINDKEAPKEYLREYKVRKLDDGLMVSNLGLSFQVSSKDFIDGVLNLKCTARIETYYSRSDEHSQIDTSANANEVRERPSEESLVRETGNTGHNIVWTSATQQTLVLTLVAALLCVDLW